MSPSVISGNKIQIKNFRMFLVIYFELRQYWYNWRKLNRSEVEERQVWLIPYEPYVMTHTVWRSLTETAGTNNLAVVSTAAGTAFRTSFWSSTVFTGAYIFTDTAKISWEKFISTNSEWSHCRFCYSGIILVTFWLSLEFLKSILGRSVACALKTFSFLTLLRMPLLSWGCVFRKTI